MSDTRDWLVLSLKWSSEWLCWYKTAANGYTTDLMHAGRYTRTEAIGHELHGVTVAVPLREALAMAKVTTQVPNGVATAGQMVKEAELRRAVEDAPAAIRPDAPGRGTP